MEVSEGIKIETQEESSSQFQLFMCQVGHLVLGC